MILNLFIDMPASAQARTTPEEGLRGSLFRLGEASQAEGERERWAWALLMAVLVHAGVAAGYVLAPARAAPPAPPPEAPELVFFSFPPPPAAASLTRTTRTSRPEPVRHRARVRPPSQTPRMPTLVEKLPEPAPEAPAETAAAPEPAPEDTSAPQEPTGIEGVGGVIGGLVGGALEGHAGGLVGASGGEALELKQVTRAPRVLSQTEPLYPRRARAEGIVGLVVVRLIIGVDGRVEPESARVLRSVPALDAAAVTAVTQWRFTPALGRQGRPVRVIVEIPIQFSLK